MTIMRIGVSWGEGWMNGGEVKVAKTIDAGGQELLSPPLSSFIYRKASMCEESVEACRGRNCALAGGEYTTAFVGQPFMYIVYLRIQSYV